MASLTADEILARLAVHGAEIRRYGVRRIGLFGSHRHGAAGEQSDLDFLVSFATPTYDNYIELKFYLEELFEKKVDLVIEENVKPALAYVKEDARYAEGI